MLSDIKVKFFIALDEKAKEIATLYCNNKPITRAILTEIINLYKAAEVEKSAFTNEKFESAYHQPITSDLEFFLARILYWISDKKELRWKIYLRRQAKNKGRFSTPDIRIDKTGKTIAILEIKAKASWMQPYLSKKRKEKDMELYRKGKEYNPKEQIKKINQQLEKYAYGFDIQKNRVYMLLPTLKGVSRKKTNEEIPDFKKQFTQHSNLPEKNLVLLSSNKNLDLSNPKQEQMQETNELEQLIKEIERN